MDIVKKVQQLVAQLHTSYIAQTKRKYGFDMRENYNKSKKENPMVKQCTIIHCLWEYGH